MLSNNCTRKYVDWCLERTIRLIGDKFTDHAILMVKSSDAFIKQFANYKNFVDYDEDFLVKYRNDFDALQHLEQLILNSRREINTNLDYQDIDFKVDDLKEIILIGFSSGGSILNQIIISLNELKIDLDKSIRRKQQNTINSSTDLSNDLFDNNDYSFGSISNSMTNSMSKSMGNSMSKSMSKSISFHKRNDGLSNSISTSFTDNRMFFEILNDAVNNRLNLFYKKLTKLIWLDLGSNAVDNRVFILDDDILQNIMDLDLEIQVHSTPRQINCTQRPHIGRQEKQFSDKFKNYPKFKRKLYLDRPATLESHFELIKDFDPS